MELLLLCGSKCELVRFLSCCCRRTVGAIAVEIKVLHLQLGSSHAMLQEGLAVPGQVKLREAAGLGILIAVLGLGGLQCAST
jgi:hypothetical protein